MSIYPILFKSVRLMVSNGRQQTQSCQISSKSVSIIYWDEESLRIVLDSLFWKIQGEMSKVK